MLKKHRGRLFRLARRDSSLFAKISRAGCVALLFPAACFAAHPLISDDTGTQGRGNFQLEINTDHSRDSDDGIEARAGVVNTALTYGWTDTLDAAVNLPYQHLRGDGEPDHSGIGDATLLLKWRFYEKNGLSFALKPMVLLPTGNEDRGLGNGRVGYGLHTLATFAMERLTLLGNIGYMHNENRIDARSDIWNISAAALYNLTSKARWIFDIGTYRNSDPAVDMNPAFALTGLIYGVNEKLDLDAGFKKGLNKAEADASWGVGLTVRW